MSDPISVRRAPARRPRRLCIVAPLAVMAVGLVAVLPIGRAVAATPVGLGTAGSFAVLAGSGITNTGPTTINGDVGTFPTPSMTGFGSVTVNGANHGGDAVTKQAKKDLLTAYGTAFGSSPTTAVATELGGTTLTPGVYGSPTLGITGILTLNTLGDPNAVFIFQAGTTLITAVDSAVIVLDGATACNVYWQVGTSATLGAGSSLIGSVLADTSISAGTGATVQGRLLAMDGAVTLDTNTITVPTCAAAATTTTTTAAPTTTTTTAAPTTTTTATPPGAAPLPGAPGSGAAPVAGSPRSAAAPVPGVPAAPGAPGAPTGAPGAPGVAGPEGSAGAPTPGGDTGRGDGSSPPTTGRPGLPKTGGGAAAALFGAATLALGAMLLGGARLRLRSAR